MRRAALTFAVVFAVGLLTLVCAGLLERRSEAFTLGVRPAVPTYVGAGGTICQGPIEVVEDFSAVRLTISAAVVSSPAARMQVRDAGTGTRLAGGPMRAGYPSAQTNARVDVGPVSAGRRVRVCLRVTGDKGLVVWGNADAAARGTSSAVNGRPREFDVAMVFLREHDSSVLGLAGEMVRRASLFHGGWVGTWTIWSLALLLAAAFPVLLGAALAGARVTEDQPTGSAPERVGAVSSER
jgi:hypothetical protein